MLFFECLHLDMMTGLLTVLGLLQQGLGTILGPGPMLGIS
jgi:hypothetical protein